MLSIGLSLGTHAKVSKYRYTIKRAKHGLFVVGNIVHYDMICSDWTS